MFSHVFVTMKYIMRILKIKIYSMMKIFICLIVQTSNVETYTETFAFPPPFFHSLISRFKLILKINFECEQINFSFRQ